MTAVYPSGGYTMAEIAQRFNVHYSTGVYKGHPYKNKKYSPQTWRPPVHQTLTTLHEKLDKAGQLVRFDAA